MKNKKVLDFITEVIDEKKGNEIKVVDVTKMTTLTNFFIICTAGASEHAKAIEEELEKRLKEKKINLLNEEGGGEGKWIVMDYGDFIIHIMTEDTRKFYNIERIWQEISSRLKRTLKS
ncbi:MAG: ribosome silencing factor [Caldisericota bacterium]|nr:ribosome silencing factor [Caldisericota bacterium]